MKQILHIRAVDSKIIAVLDEIAKEKKISRSKLIREILYNYILFSDYKTMEENFKSITDLNTKVLIENIEILETIKKELGEIIYE